MEVARIRKIGRSTLYSYCSENARHASHGGSQIINATKVVEREIISFINAHDGPNLIMNI